jgi:peptide/nickel transport system ATP-binding protein
MGEVDDPIIEARNVSVTFDMERGESKVLDGVDLAIERGEVLGLVGESGSGKSMFASSLLDAVVEPGILTGEITYYPEPDRPVDLLDLSKRELRQTRWEEVAMVFQGAMSSFNPTISVRAHFEETLDAHNEDYEEGMDRAYELLSDLYLQPERVLDSYPHELSGGMQQRALIALAMVLEPKLLVMDEPTAALDLLMQQSILKMLREVKRKYDITLLFITHDPPLVADLSDRMVVMYAFEFVERGTKTEILGDASHPYTRALLNATPNLGLEPEEMNPIKGSAPDPVNVPSGCSYHPRCPLATEECVSDDPPLEDIGEDHRAACHHWEQAREEIPLNYGESSADPEFEASPDRDVAARTDEQPVLELEDVEVHFEEDQGLFDIFGGEPEVVKAVDGVDLDIYENDVVALLGESGCGKTTLGKTAIGLQRPTGGSVNYRGQDIWEAKDGDGDIPYDEIRQSLQIIHQDPGASLNPNRRIVDILSEPLHHTHPNISPNERRDRIYSLLDRVGMNPPDDFADRYPHQLSGGEKQRVALTRALLMNPDAILADEAISAVDVSLRVELMDLMLELQDVFDTSFLFISHDLSNARYFTEHGDGRIAVMYLGEIVEIGTAERLIQDPRHPYTKALRCATPI